MDENESKGLNGPEQGVSPAHESEPEAVRSARRTAAVAACLTFLMAVLKGVVGTAMHSDVLLADALHSAVDLLALGASWFGLFLAGKRPSERFPYGFYRAETLAALAASAVIMFFGGRLALKGVHSLRAPAASPAGGLILVTASASALFAFLISRWEKSVSRRTGSQSLAATADEARLDVASSILVFAAILGTRFGIFVFEGIVTILISLVVMVVGFKNLRLAVLSLMDASVDPELERQVISILELLPGVREVEKLRSRRAGPFYFVDGHIKVAGSMDVMRSHSLCHEAQTRIHNARPDVEGVILHVEPYQSTEARILIPVEDESGMDAPVAAHFGRAPRFLMVVLDGDSISSSETHDNIFRNRKVRTALSVIHRIIADFRPDVVLVRQIGEIAYHTLRDHYIQIYRSSDESAGEAIRRFIAKQCEILTAPTHSSETGADRPAEAASDSPGGKDDEAHRQGLP